MWMEFVNQDGFTSRIIKQLTKIKDEELPDSKQAGYQGSPVSSKTVEAVALNTEKILAVDGIHNVIKIL